MKNSVKYMVFMMSWCIMTMFFCPDARGNEVFSPDRDLRVVVADDLSQTVFFKGKKVFTISPDIELTGKPITFKRGKVSARTVSENHDAAFYRKDIVADRYSELLIKVAKGWDMQMRAYDDGIAYRWVYTGKSPVRIADERADYLFYGNCEATVPYVRCKDPDSFSRQFFNSFENTYTVSGLQDLDSRRLCFLPLTVKTPDDVTVLLTESAVCGYPGMYLNGGEGQTLKSVFAPRPRKVRRGGYLDIQMLVEETEDYIAAIDGPRSLPWRIAVVSDDDRTLASNDLTWLLAAPSGIEDTSWIKPGKVAWEWWNNWNLYGVDFKTGVNNDTYRAYIDFASRNGIEYIILDDGWSVKGSGDLFSVVPEIDLPLLVEYGRERGVGIILWAGYVPFEKDMEEVCRHYSEMGIKGFKVDFLDRNDQMMSEFEWKAAETAAKYNLILDIHGTHMPAGMNRTWPNVLNFEGVHGLENLKWSGPEVDQVTYDSYLPFIRQNGGPMDYTPGAMRNATKESYHASYGEPMSQGTRCRQLALYVVLDSPLAMLCDSPSNYDAAQESTDFIAGVPTTWDETVVLEGKLGQYIVTARRKGDIWYIGAINDWTPREIEIDCSFLPSGGSYSVDAFADGPNATKVGKDYKRTRTALDSRSVIRMQMAPGGGYVARIAP